MSPTHSKIHHTPLSLVVRRIYGRSYDSRVGRAIQEKVNSFWTSSFVIRLVFNDAISSVETLAFAVIRRIFHSVYEPRARFLLGDSKRIKHARQRGFSEHNLTMGYFWKDVVRLRIFTFLGAFVPIWHSILEFVILVFYIIPPSALPLK